MFHSAFNRFDNTAVCYSGKATTFVVALLAILVWAAVGPIFKFSETWQLVVNTGTTIITFLMVFLLQNSQNRDTAALHVKIDELILVSQGRNALIGVEASDAEEIEKLSKQLEEEAAEGNCAAKGLLEKLPRSSQGERTMAEKTLDDLFLNTLKDIYYAEKKILKALPKMAKAAESEELSQAFLTHRDQTEGQIERLEQVFEILDKAARGKQCDAIEGIIAEGEEIMEEFEETAALDAGLVSAAQAVEHYEIARYGTLKAWAIELGMNDAAKLIDQNLKEEEQTDKLLTSLGKGLANQRAKAA